MFIKPFVIGPSLAINPDLAIVPLDGLHLPIPAVSVSTREMVLLLGENQDIALSIDFWKYFVMSGKTGQHEASVTCVQEENQYHVKGVFGGHYGDYFLTPIEDGAILKGNIGQHYINLRINTNKAFSKFTGFVDKSNIDIVMEDLIPNVVGVSGKVHLSNIDVKIKYSDTGIEIKGFNEDRQVAYTLQSLGDKIEMKGITRDQFSHLIYTLDGEDMLHVTGTAKKVPVEYDVSLYDNGVTVAGNTGYFKSDYGFVVSEPNSAEEVEKVEEKAAEADSSEKAEDKAEPVNIAKEDEKLEEAEGAEVSV